MYTHESLAALRQRVDLVELVRAYVPLKRMGVTYKACCPFHEERTPSFVVKPGDAYYHCFGCGAHGDAISFIMQHLSLGFIDAVELLAQRYAVTLERADSNQQEGPRSEHRALLERAARLAHYLLLHTDEGHMALQYLFARGLTLEVVRQFCMGWWPKNGLLKLLKDNGASAELLTSTGIISQRGHEYFGDRITIPIRSATGAVIGFTARKLHEGTLGGKYVNTPETELFKKSRVLFGLDRCRRRIAKERRCIIVEGQLDAIALISNGLNLTIATQGTAFAEGHLHELRALGVQEAWLLFDGDAAGVEAAIKSGLLLQSAAIRARVCQLPKGQDPDQLIQQSGPRAILKLLSNAEDYLAYRYRLLAEQGQLEDPTGRARSCKQLADLVKSWDDHMLVHASLVELARLFKVPLATLGVGKAPMRPSKPAAPISASKPLHNQEIESDLLRWVIRLAKENHSLVLDLLQQLPAEVVTCARRKRLYEYCCQRLKNGQGLDLLDLADFAQDDEDLKLIDTLLQKRLPMEKGATLLVETAQKLLELHWLQQCESIKTAIMQPDASEAEALELARAYAEKRRYQPKLILAHHPA